MVGGGEHSFIDLINNLSPDWIPIAVFPHQGELAQLCLHQGIKHHILNLHRLRPQYIHKNLKCLIALVRLIRRENPRVIYANGSRAAFYGSLASRLCSIPSIWHCRIAEPDPALDFILGNLCTHIIANSKATSRRFPRRYQSKVSVIYNGLNLRWLRSQRFKKANIVQNDWKVILVVARLSKWKQHDLALKAFEKVAAEDPRTHLICVGGKDPEDPLWSDYLKMLAAESKFYNRIHWIGKVEDIRPWYRAATVLLLPSENEPFGRVVIEAMACGVPVVATRGGGVPELISDSGQGFLVDSDNIEEMSKALQTILSKNALRKALAYSAEKKANFFNLEKHTSEMESIFKRLALCGDMNAS